MECEIWREVVFFEVCCQRWDSFALDNCCQCAGMCYESLLFLLFFRYLRFWCRCSDCGGLLLCSGGKSSFVDMGYLYPRQLIKTSQQLSFCLLSALFMVGYTGRLVVNGNPRIFGSLLFNIAPSFPNNVRRLPDPLARINIKSHCSNACFHDAS